MKIKLRPKISGIKPLNNVPSQMLVIDQVPELCEDLLSSVDQPLKIARDSSAGKDYLLCDYNRDGDSYRWVKSRSVGGGMVGQEGRGKVDTGGSDCLLQSTKKDWPSIHTATEFPFLENSYIRF